MKFRCPFCQKDCNYMEIKGDADLMEIIRIQPVFGASANLVWGYLEFFGITPMRGQAKRIRNLVTEMKALFEAKTFSYEKKNYVISQKGIVEALEIINRRSFSNKIPNHNYLKQIMITIVENEDRQAGAQAEKALRKKENQLRYPIQEERVEAEPQMTPELRDQVDRLLGRHASGPVPMPPEDDDAEVMKQTPVQQRVNCVRVGALLGVLLTDDKR